MYFMSDPQALHVTRNVIPGKLGVDLQYLHRVHIPLVVNGLQAYNLPQLGSRDTTVVCVTYNHNGRLQNLLVASVYMAIDKGLPVAELDNIIRHSASTGLPVVIAGDSNAHHPAWGCQEQNARGLALMNSWQPLSWKYLTITKVVSIGLAVTTNVQSLMLQ